MTLFTLKTIDEIITNACRDLNATIITFPYPETSLNVLRNNGVAKSAAVKFKTARTGITAGHVILSDDDLHHIPDGFHAVKKNDTWVLVDKQNRFVTSDLDLLTVIVKGCECEKPFHDDEYGQTTLVEKRVIEYINEAGRAYGIEKLVMHGSLTQYKKPDFTLIKFPLEAYTNDGKFSIETPDALQFINSSINS